MAFFLFILVNAALFIRPAEIVPAWQGWEIYFYLIVTCLAFAIPDVLRHLTAEPIDKQPITLCVFAMLVAIVIPTGLALGTAEALRGGILFAKVIAYYLLFVSLITTPERLRILLISIVVFCACVTALAVLRFHDIIQMVAIDALPDSRDDIYGGTITIMRLQGTGIFHDPNELCVLLSAMIPLCLYFLITGSNLVLRGLCVGLMPLFSYAVMLTGSRGGFIAFAGGLGALVWARYGWKKAAWIGALGLPVLLVLFAGRQTEISTGSGTAMSRVELWREWLTTFKESPLYGNGMTLRPEDDGQPRRPDVGKKLVAHNSYLQSFADLGLIGGSLFVGALFIAIWSVYRVNPAESLIVHREVRQIQPYVLASMVAYGLGMMSLSICYVIPTYLMLALSVAYTHLAHQSALMAPPPLRFDLSLLGRMAAAGVFTLFSIYVFVRFLA